MAKVNPIRFSTKYQDDESDIVMYPYRPYSASTGRWLSRDPIQEFGGQNLYGFSREDSINFFDPFGLKKCGVEFFVVKWTAADPKSTKVFHLEVHIRFKSGNGYDPRCCEYKQLVSSKYTVTRGGKIIYQNDNSPLHDDGYSRTNDIFGMSDPNDTEFMTDDNPGWKNYNGFQEGDIVNYEFTAEQIVYSPGKSFPGNSKKGIKPCDCEKDDNVAQRGPHTGTQTGTFFKDLHLGGVPVTLGSPDGK